MDITKSAKKLYTTRLINGETVNYTVVFSAVSLLLLVLKQAFKLIFGVGAGVSTAISAVICAIVLFFGEKKFVCIAAMMLGLLLCYAFGTAWFMILYARQSGPIGVGTALGWCVIPFVIPDLCKMALAIVLSNILKKHIK